MLWTAEGVAGKCDIHMHVEHVALLRNAVVVCLIVACLMHVSCCRLFGYVVVPVVVVLGRRYRHCDIVGVVEGRSGSTTSYPYISFQSWCDCLACQHIVIACAYSVVVMLTHVRCALHVWLFARAFVGKATIAVRPRVARGPDWGRHDRFVGPRPSPRVV